MIEVNIYIVNSLITLLAGLALSDEEVEELYAINPNDEIKVKEAIKHFIVPGFDAYPPKVKERVKEALKYLLNTTDEGSIKLVTNMNEPPFEFPTPVINYFIWIWEVLFGEESYKIENIDEYIVNNKFGTIYYLE